MYKRGVIWISIIAILLCSVFVFAQEDPFGFGEEEVVGEEEEIIKYENLEDISEPGVVYDSGDSETPATLDITQQPLESEFEVTSIPQETVVTTPQGSVTGVEWNNALFSSGDFIQGSIFSFENENNIFFGSIFGTSEFMATLDEGGEVDIAQKNAFGDLGKVHVTLDGATLTQDEDIIFTPNGEAATYIYYNSTDVEFEGGTVELLGESVTNAETDDSTTISFDESGFTRLQLHPQNTYIAFDYQIDNTGVDTLLVCKNDPFCDINIEGDVFTIRGKADFTYLGDVIYNGIDPNNEVIIDPTGETFTISNAKPREEILAIFYRGHHKITETQDQVYDLPVREETATLISTYISRVNDKTFTFDTDDTLNFEDSFRSYIELTPADVDGVSPEFAPESTEPTNREFPLAFIVGIAVLVVGIGGYLLFYKK